MIGNNDTPGETFDQVSVNMLLEFAKITPWVSELRMWSVNRDIYEVSGVIQTPNEFAMSFNQFGKECKLMPHLNE
jgi:hypothetical protein